MPEKVTSLNDIIAFLGNEIKSIEGNPEGLNIHYLKDSENVDEYTLDWVNPVKPDKQHIAETSKAKVIIVGSGIEYSAELKKQGKVILLVDNPRLTIAKVGNAFFIDKIEPMIHPTVVIHSDAKIGNDVYIGAYSKIGKCTIGDNTIIHTSVCINDHTEIGENVVVKPGAILGYDGFGFEKQENGHLLKFPQLGKLIIRDYVEIGANTCIDKGALSDTIIGEGTKINNLCHIAHNVVIGKNVVITAHVNISGSSIIEDNVWIAPNSSLKGHQTIGEGSTVGMGAVVTKNIPSGEVWVGNPARKIR